MTLFTDFELPKSLTQSLQKMNYAEPTPIQAAAIPLALEGKDVLGTAQTGTGKTAAFSVPLVAYLLNNPGETALVLTPTRELAVQVMTVVQQLLQHNREIKTALLIGGESMGKQFGQLKMNPRVIVGTPGRINDHLNRRTLKLDRSSFLVLDETDRMLDMGFGVQLDAIAEYLPQERQTLMFSATLPKSIMRMANKYLNEPERVSMGEANAVAANIKQETVFLPESEKYERLLSELDQREGSVIVFVKTKYGADKMADRLSARNHQADAIHGDLRQNQRDRAIRDFRNNRYRILVATDVAARGLDIPHIRHVINYDLPQCAEDYIHRIGRTARAGAEGEALCLISPQDNVKWRAIRRLMDPNSTDEAPRQRASRSGEKTFGGKKFGEKKSGRFGGGFKPREERGERAERGDRFEPRGERAEQRSAPKKAWSPVGFRHEEERGGTFNAQRRDGKPQGEKPRGGSFRRDDRQEGRREGRPEGRFEGRKEYRQEGRQEHRESRYEGRPENRGEQRGGKGREFRSYDDKPMRREDRPEHQREPREDRGFRPKREGSSFSKEKGFGGKEKSFGGQGRFEGRKPQGGQQGRFKKPGQARRAG